MRNDLTIGLDTIADIMTAIDPPKLDLNSGDLPPSFANAALPDHTSSIVATAHYVMSTAQSVLSESRISRSGSVLTATREPDHRAVASEIGAPMTTADRSRILNWIPSQHSSNDPWRSTIPGTTIMTPSTTDNESRNPDERCSSSDVEDDDLDVEAVDEVFKIGYDHMINSKFADAEMVFSTGVERLESMTKKTRHRLDIDEQRLWLAYSRIYQAKTSNLLPVLHALSQSRSSTLLGLRALYAIAWFHLCDMRNSNLELAEGASKQVIRGLKKHFGENSKYHVIYHRSLAVLIAICRIRGDDLATSVYKNIIRSASADTQADGKIDDIPEPSIHKVRLSSLRVQNGDKLNLYISSEQSGDNRATKFRSEWGKFFSVVVDQECPSMTDQEITDELRKTFVIYSLGMGLHNIDKQSKDGESFSNNSIGMRLDETRFLFRGIYVHSDKSHNTSMLKYYARLVSVVSLEAVIERERALVT